MEINTDRLISDIGNGYINSTLFFTHLLGGAAIAFIVNKVAQSQFDNKEAAQGTKILGFASGVGASYYFARNFPLHKYVSDSASYLLAVIVPALGTYPLVGMFAGQFFNQYSLVVFGTIGATLGTFLS